MPAVWAVWIKVERMGGHLRWAASRPLTYTRARAEVGKFERMGVPAKIEMARRRREDVEDAKPKQRKRQEKADGGAKHRIEFRKPEF
jgi:hypothetical protein